MVFLGCTPNTKKFIAVTSDDVKVGANVLPFGSFITELVFIYRFYFSWICCMFFSVVNAHIRFGKCGLFAGHYFYPKVGTN